MVSVPRAGGEHALKLLLLLLCGRPTQNPHDSRWIAFMLVGRSVHSQFFLIFNIFFFCLGTDLAAADAGQVSDHVRPDYWAKYPSTYACFCQCK